MEDCSQLLPLDQIKPGMRLAEPIRDRLGNLMLTEGSTLTEHSLESLKQRGVSAAMIHIEPPPMSEADRQVLKQSIQQRIDYLFRASANAPLNAQLKDMIFAYRVEQLK